MVVRVVTFDAASLDRFDEWVESRSAALECVVGLQRVEFVRRNDPPRAGVIMYFQSPEDLRQYQNSRWYESEVSDSGKLRVAEAPSVKEQVYRVVDVL